MSSFICYCIHLVLYLLFIILFRVIIIIFIWNVKTLTSYCILLISIFYRSYFTNLNFRYRQTKLVKIALSIQFYSKLIYKYDTSNSIFLIDLCIKYEIFLRLIWSWYTYILYVSLFRFRYTGCLKKKMGQTLRYVITHYNKPFLYRKPGSHTIQSKVECDSIQLELRFLKSIFWGL